jgi:hypothetical protein
MSEIITIFLLRVTGGLKDRQPEGERDWKKA